MPDPALSRVFAKLLVSNLAPGGLEQVFETGQTRPDSTGRVLGSLALRLGQHRLGGVAERATLASETGSLKGLTLCGLDLVGLVGGDLRGTEHVALGLLAAEVVRADNLGVETASGTGGNGDLSSGREGLEAVLVGLEECADGTGGGGVRGLRHFGTFRLRESSRLVLVLFYYMWRVLSTVLDNFLEFYFTNNFTIGERIVPTTANRITRPVDASRIITAAKIAIIRNENKSVISPPSIRF